MQHEGETFSIYLKCLQRADANQNHKAAANDRKNRLLLCGSKPVMKIFITLPYARDDNYQAHT